jgi:hypothetical protein
LYPSAGSELNTLGTAGLSNGIEAVLAAVNERQLARELRMTFNTALLTLADTMGREVYQLCRAYNPLVWAQLGLAACG